VSRWRAVIPLVQCPTPPSARGGLSLKRNLSLGLIPGAVRGFTLAGWLEGLARRIKRADDVSVGFAHHRRAGPAFRSLHPACWPRSPRPGSGGGRREQPTLPVDALVLELFSMLRISIRHLIGNGGADSCSSPSAAPRGGARRCRTRWSCRLRRQARVVFVDANFHGAADLRRGRRRAQALDRARRRKPTGRARPSSAPDAHLCRRKLTLLLHGPVDGRRPNCSTPTACIVLAELGHQLDAIVISVPALYAASDGAHPLPIGGCCPCRRRLGHMTRNALAWSHEQLQIADARRWCSS
jgi:hypothetical protein